MAEWRKVSISMEMDEGHEVAAVVVITHEPGTTRWAAGLKRGENPPPSAWVAERLRATATELELQGMAQGESGE